jgi:hypothetical protein
MKSKLLMLYLGVMLIATLILFFISIAIGFGVEINWIDPEYKDHVFLNIFIGAIGSSFFAYNLINHIKKTRH